MAKNKRPLVFSVTYRIVLIVAATMLLLSYSAIYINPSTSTIPLFFGLYFIPILLINIILLIISLVFRSKGVWIQIIVIIPALLFAERFYKIGSSAPDTNDGRIVRIQSYNIATGAGAKIAGDQQSIISKIAQEIQENKPDIVCLQEYMGWETDSILSIFPQYQYYSKNFNTRKGRVNGILTLSKFPIIKSQRVNFSNSTNKSIFSDIVIGDDTIRLYNNHLESYSISFKRIFQKIFLKEKKYDHAKEEIVRVHKKIDKTLPIRAQQIDSISNLIYQSKYPTIICGDLNETPISYAYNKIKKGHNDTFLEAGKGFGATYTFLYPLLRIDYIFVPKYFTTISHKTLKSKLSDHYPVVVEFSIPQKRDE